MKNVVLHSPVVPGPTPAHQKPSSQGRLLWTRQGLLRLSLSLLLCLCLSACASMPFGRGGTDDKMPPPSSSEVAEARAAWNSNDMSRAEKLYGLLTNSAKITASEKNEAWQRLALAASRNGRSARSLQALEQWHKAVPTADSLPAWQDAWFNNVRVLPPSEAIKKAKALWVAKGYSEGARARAALILMGRAWTVPQCTKALPLLSATYASLDASQRVAIERGLSGELRYMSIPTLAELVKAAPAAPTFPQNIFLLEEARRQSVLPGGGNSAALLQRIRLSTADAGLINSVMGAMPTPPAPQAAAPQIAAFQPACIVLALPAGGPFAPIATRIQNGATAAQQELVSGGVNVRIEKINTDAPDWLAQLETLPPACTVVGGPLHAPVYAAAKAAAHTRAFFTFMPQLGNGEEGRLAWRFFPSPEDQVATLLRFTRQDLNINTYGAFYPGDTYGLRMTSIFEQGVKTGGGTVEAVSYPPTDMSTWTQKASQLLKPRTVNKVPISGATFQALFLPDSWKNMEMITTSLFYHGEDRQVLMGTTLWEQGLTGQSALGTFKYELAVFPGAWNPAQVPTALQSQGGVDFWTALGYDFIRFGSAMGLNAPAQAAAVTASAQKAQNMPWAMAPIHWNSQGIANQQLFLFTPTATGFAPLDVQAFKDRLALAISRFENRSRAASAAPKP